MNKSNKIWGWYNLKIIHHCIGSLLISTCTSGRVKNFFNWWQIEWFFINITTWQAKSNKITSQCLNHYTFFIVSMNWRDSHNLDLGFIQLKRNVCFDSTDHDCPKETTTIRMGTKSHKVPWKWVSIHISIHKHSTNRNQRTRLSTHYEDVLLLLT